MQIVGGAVWSGTVGGITFEAEPLIRYDQGAAAAPWLSAHSAPAVENVTGRVRVQVGDLPKAVCQPKLQPGVAKVDVNVDCVTT